MKYSFLIKSFKFIENDNKKEKKNTHTIIYYTSCFTVFNAHFVVSDFIISTNLKIKLNYFHVILKLKKVIL